MIKTGFIKIYEEKISCFGKNIEDTYYFFGKKLVRILLKH